MKEGGGCFLENMDIHPTPVRQLNTDNHREVDVKVLKATYLQPPMTL